MVSNQIKVHSLNHIGQSRHVKQLLLLFSLSWTLVVTTCIHAPSLILAIHIYSITYFWKIILPFMTTSVRLNVLSISTILSLQLPWSWVEAWEEGVWWWCWDWPQHCLTLLHHSTTEHQTTDKILATAVITSDLTFVYGYEASLGNCNKYHQQHGLLFSLSALQEKVYIDIWN